MYHYDKVEVAEGVRCYSSPQLRGSYKIEKDEDYARARAAIPTFCLDGLLCGRMSDGEHAILLIQRASEGESSGPFRNMLWLAGGRWDMISPWTVFVEKMVRKEVFSEGMKNDSLKVGNRIGDQFFCTGWGENEDGPYGYSGMTVQFCYQVLVDEPLDLLGCRPDENHQEFAIIKQSDELPELHPYVRDVIQMSEWF